MTEFSKILIVDDDPANLTLLERQLMPLGHRLFKATSGLAALSILAQQSFDLIILDVLMPEMSGFETAQAIRQQSSGIYTPIMFITGHLSAEAMVKGYALGAVAYLEKPISGQAIRSKVDQLLHSPQEADAQASQRLTKAAIIAAEKVLQTATDNATEAARVLAVAATEAKRLIAETLAIARGEAILPKTVLSRRELWMSWGSLGVLSTALGLVLWVVWLLVIPYPAVSSFTIKSLTPIVKAGELYKWQVNYCVEGAPTSLTIGRELEEQSGNRTRYPLPTIESRVMQRCEQMSRTVLLPDELPPGQYHLHITTTVRVNPLRTVQQTFIGDTIEVIR